MATFFCVNEIMEIKSNWFLIYRDIILHMYVHYIMYMYINYTVFVLLHFLRVPHSPTEPCSDSL